MIGFTWKRCNLWLGLIFITSHSLVQAQPAEIPTSLLTTDQPVLKGLFQHPEFLPVEKAEVAGHSFYLSKVFEMGGGFSYDAVLIYVENGGKILPRLLYQSQSDGAWRGTPGFNERVILKGSGYNHYTQTTKVHPELSRFIRDYANKAENRLPGGNAANTQKLSLALERELDIGRLERNHLDTFFEESKAYVPQGQSRFALRYLRALTPGMMSPDHIDDLMVRAHKKESDLEESIKGDFEFFSPLGARLMSETSGHPLHAYFEVLKEHVQKFEVFQKFFPDFSKPALEFYQVSHSFLSAREGDGTAQQDVQVFVYPAQLDGNEIEWHIAKHRDASGVERVWIDRIRLKGVGMTTYGTDATWIDSGILTSKVFEYQKQVRALQELSWVELLSDAFPRNVRITYCDQTLFLKQFPGIEQFLKLTAGTGLLKRERSPE